jgi:la-related protein 1
MPSPFITHHCIIAYHRVQMECYTRFSQISICSIPDGTTMPTLRSEVVVQCLSLPSALKTRLDPIPSANAFFPLTLVSASAPQLTKNCCNELLTMTAATGNPLSGDKLQEVLALESKLTRREIRLGDPIQVIRSSCANFVASTRRGRKEGRKRIAEQEKQLTAHEGGAKKAETLGKPKELTVASVNSIALKTMRMIQKKGFRSLYFERRRFIALLNGPLDKDAASKYALRLKVLGWFGASSLGPHVLQLSRGFASKEKDQQRAICRTVKQLIKAYPTDLPDSNQVAFAFRIMRLIRVSAPSASASKPTASSAHPTNQAVSDAPQPAVVPDQIAPLVEVMLQERETLDSQIRSIDEFMMAKEHQRQDQQRLLEQVTDGQNAKLGQPQDLHAAADAAANELAAMLKSTAEKSAKLKLAVEKSTAEDEQLHKLAEDDDATSEDDLTEKEKNQGKNRETTAEMKDGTPPDSELSVPAGGSILKTTEPANSANPVMIAAAEAVGYTAAVAAGYGQHPFLERQLQIQRLQLNAQKSVLNAIVDASSPSSPTSAGQHASLSQHTKDDSLTHYNQGSTSTEALQTLLQQVWAAASTTSVDDLDVPVMLLLASLVAVVLAKAASQAVKARTNAVDESWLETVVDFKGVSKTKRSSTPKNATTPKRNKKIVNKSVVTLVPNFGIRSSTRSNNPKDRTSNGTSPSAPLPACPATTTTAQQFYQQPLYHVSSTVAHSDSRPVQRETATMVSRVSEDNLFLLAKQLKQDEQGQHMQSRRSATHSEQRDGGTMRRRKGKPRTDNGGTKGKQANGTVSRSNSVSSVSSFACSDSSLDCPSLAPSEQQVQRTSRSLSVSGSSDRSSLSTSPSPVAPATARTAIAATVIAATVGVPITQKPAKISGHVSSNGGGSSAPVHRRDQVSDLQAPLAQVEGAERDDASTLSPVDQKIVAPSMWGAGSSSSFAAVLRRNLSSADKVETKGAKPEKPTPSQQPKGARTVQELEQELEKSARNNGKQYASKLPDSLRPPLVETACATAGCGVAPNHFGLSPHSPRSPCVTPGSMQLHAQSQPMLRPVLITAHYTLKPRESLSVAFTPGQLIAGCPDLNGCYDLQGAMAMAPEAETVDGGETVWQVGLLLPVSLSTLHFKFVLVDYESQMRYLEEPESPARTLMLEPPTLEEQQQAVRRQVEHYFSAENLCKDFYLRSNMDADGFVLVSLIANFNMLQKLRGGLLGLADVVAALAPADMLQLGRPENQAGRPELVKVRMRHGAQQFVLPEAIASDCIPY